MRIIPARFCQGYIPRMLDHFSQFNPSPLSIKQFMDFGENACEKRSFNFLRKELPVRLANIMKEINLLPPILQESYNVKQVKSLYRNTFEEVLLYENAKPTDDNMQKFCKDLEAIRKRHSNVVETMAEGVMDMRTAQNGHIEPPTEQAIQYFLDRLYMSRIGIRTLINQHVELFREGQIPGARGNWIGCINRACNIADELRNAYEDASRLCEEYYLACPQMEIVQHSDEQRPISITYVPSHLHYIFFELFKNSMRAVVEHDDYTKCGELPKIKVSIVQGKEDICIKISDYGGGIPRSQGDQLFKYMYSTAPQPTKSDRDTVPFAGFGYGLPISRLYARYFQGDLVLLSCDGHGTDAVVYLKADYDEANELLPIFNKTSERNYNPTTPTADWSNQVKYHRKKKLTVEQ